MDLSNLKNLDLNDVLNKLKSGEIGNKKILIQFAIGFGAVLIFLIGYYFFISPIIVEQKEKINLMNNYKNEINESNDKIVQLREEIKKLEPKYNKNNKLFHSKKEVEDLYQNISKFALMNSLSITNLKKGEPLAVLNQDATSQELQEVIYYKIPVEYEIRGNFLSYLKFRRALSKSNKVINFDREEINHQEEIQGQILSKGVISIVGLPNEYN